MWSLNYVTTFMKLNNLHCLRCYMLAWGPANIWGEGWGVTSCDRPLSYSGRVNQCLLSALAPKKLWIINSLIYFLNYEKDFNFQYLCENCNLLADLLSDSSHNQIWSYWCMLNRWLDDCYNGGAIFELS